VNKIVDKLFTCLHWFDLLFPGRKNKIDWRNVGEMRARLVKMRFGDKITSANSLTVSTEVNGSMMMNFRTMSNDRSKKSLSHWYSKETDAKREKDLTERVVSGQRAHEARQTSGAYQAIAEKDAAELYAESGYEEQAVYEVQQQPLTKEAEAKLADFLSGNSDDMNSFLFTNLSTGEETGSIDPFIHEEEVTKETGLAGKFRRTKTNDAVSQNSDVIAALEEAHKLDSYVREDSSETSCSAPSSVAEETVVSSEVASNCSSLDEARSRKAATVKSKLLKKLYTV
jgi:hypothetical protein